MLVDERLRQFDESAQAWRQTKRTEFAMFARAWEMPAEMLAMETARIDAVGQWETAARRALELGHEPGKATVALMGAFADSMSGRTATATEPESLEAHARRLADMWERNPASVQPDSLDDVTRQAVREELLKRRTAA